MKEKYNRYSVIKTDSSKLSLRKFKKTNNSILLDTPSYFWESMSRNYRTLKTLLIDEETCKNKTITINCVTAENIYINNQVNKGDFTIPYEFLLKNEVALRLTWENIYVCNLKQINVVVNDKTVSITLNSPKEIIVFSDNNNLIIEIKNDKLSEKYSIDNKGISNKKITDYKITKDDIVNGVADLREYTNCEKVTIDNYLSFDKLIVNKYIFKNLDRFQINSRYKILNIIDDDKMKLMPLNYNIEKKGKINKFKIKEDYVIFIEGKNPKILYIDKSNNIKIIEENSLKNSGNIENVKFYLSVGISEENNYLILIKYKNGKYIVREHNKEYKITELFKKYLLINLEKYYLLMHRVSVIKELSNNNLFYILEESGVSNFKTTYADFLKFKEHIKKLLELGFSYKALIYFYEKNYSDIINNFDKENLYEFEKYEIKYFNEIGKEYVREKRSKQSGDIHVKKKEYKNSKL